MADNEVVSRATVDTSAATSSLDVLNGQLRDWSDSIQTSTGGAKSFVSALSGGIGVATQLVGVFGTLTGVVYASYEAGKKLGTALFENKEAIEATRDSLESAVAFSERLLSIPSRLAGTPTATEIAKAKAGIGELEEQIEALRSEIQYANQSGKEFALQLSEDHRVISAVEKYDELIRKRRELLQPGVVADQAVDVNARQREIQAITKSIEDTEARTRRHKYETMGAVERLDAERYDAVAEQEKKIDSARNEQERTALTAELEAIKEVYNARRIAAATQIEKTAQDEIAARKKIEDADKAARESADRARQTALDRDEEAARRVAETMSAEFKKVTDQLREDIASAVRDGMNDGLRNLNSTLSNFRQIVELQGGGGGQRHFIGGRQVQ